MSYFAYVVGSTVQEVIRADQEFIDTLPNSQSWIQTSYNTRGGIHYGPDGKPDGGIALRANYAYIGGTYDNVHDVFYDPQPYPSWIIGAPAWIWEAPIPYPEDGNFYIWNEQTLSWQQITPIPPVVTE